MEQEEQQLQVDEHCQALTMLLTGLEAKLFPWGDRGKPEKRAMEEENEEEEEEVDEDEDASESMIAFLLCFLPNTVSPQPV